jgi:predicted GNAT superfamily acetyltransferase
MTADDDVTSMDAVSNLTGTRDEVADRAVRAADAAAEAAGATVRDITDLDELDDVVRLYATIWGRGANPPVTIELLRAFTKAGNYVSGAFDGDRLLGACVGFFGAPAEDSLHSHIAGVATAAHGRSIGFALKLHQRSWALQRGISEVVWTFDPLVSRNAYFNLVKLGARPAEYLQNFYGPMLDNINGDDDSDRLLVRWRLRDPRVVAACSGAGVRAVAADEVEAGAVVALGRSPAGHPVLGDGSERRARTALVAVPPDIQTMRVDDPATARDWRVAVRQVLTGLLREGAVVSGFDRSGWYVVSRPGPAGARR